MSSSESLLSFSFQSLLWDDCSSDEYESFNSDDVSPSYRRQSRKSFSSTPKKGPRRSKGSKGSIDSKGSLGSIPMSAKGSATVHYSAKGHSVTIRDSGQVYYNPNFLPNFKHFEIHQNISKQILQRTVISWSFLFSVLLFSIIFFHSLKPFSTLHSSFSSSPFSIVLSPSFLLSFYFSFFHLFFLFLPQIFTHQLARTRER